VSPWERVVEATEKHNIDRVTVVVTEDRPWVYVTCTCGEEFSEAWDFPDHIRRLTFVAALDGEPS
jgi:hypothetical protein